MSQRAVPAPAAKQWVWLCDTFSVKKKKSLWVIVQNDLRGLKTNWASSHRLLNLLPSGLLFQLLLLLKLLLTFHGCLLFGLLLGQTLQAEGRIQAQNMLNQFEVNIQSPWLKVAHTLSFFSSIWAIFCSIFFFFSSSLCSSFTLASNTRLSLSSLFLQQARVFSS